jgi:tRNA dimethylallyltransferase
MRRAFFIAGPTATGKSELAADVAREINAEIVSVDAFQIYQGLDLLTAKPHPSTLAKTHHHLIGTTPVAEDMNAEKYRRTATRAINEINSRGKVAIIVGGSGLYIKALTHGLARLPASDPKLREKLNTMSLDELHSRLEDLDPEAAEKIDANNRRRLVRALEICLLTGKPASAQLSRRGNLQITLSGGLETAGPCHPLQTGLSASRAAGLFIFRNREELYERINQRVEAMFEHGVIEEVRTAGMTSATASQVIGLRQIRELLNGTMSLSQCIAAIQQATRRYAKRQLTWFRRQTSFLPLNLSLLSHNEARILLRMRLEPERVSEIRTTDD